MNFSEEWKPHSWNEITDDIQCKTTVDVERAIYHPGKKNLRDFQALLSPAAEPYLQEMASLSRELTLKRFGRVQQLYIPLYLSNACQNICTYCGFSRENEIPRKILNPEEILQEVQVLKSMGFDHVLLVTGEDNQTVGMPYLEKSLDLIRPHFSQVSMEVQPLETQEYALLAVRGLHAVLLYQETYNRDSYKLYHPKGKKSLFEYRLDGPDRIGRAGIHKIGLGCLLGLEDWRTDSFFTALHLNHLKRRYWRTRFSLSFPRMRPFSGDSGVHLRSENLVSTRHLTQLICAYRIFDPDLELSLSTREEPAYRDLAIQIGITTLSAASKTNPGGYSAREESLEQFEVGDLRSVQEVAEKIRLVGYEPVWKDWEEMGIAQRKEKPIPTLG